jgi:threonine dehydrogenase-like Zn-dependent dehydrogenase
MRGAVLYGPRDVRFEERAAPTIVEPTDALIRLSATCICGSDLWPYRGISATDGPTPMGHEYCGIVEDIGRAVKSITPGQFVIGSFFASDNCCPHCQLIDQVMKGAINPGKVFDLTLPLDQVAEGYRAMDERRAIKTLLRP